MCSVSLKGKIFLKTSIIKENDLKPHYHGNHSKYNKMKNYIYDSILCKYSIMFL